MKQIIFVISEYDITNEPRQLITMKAKKMEINLIFLDEIQKLPKK